MTARSLILGAFALLALAGPVAAADLDDDPPPRFEGRSEWRPTPPPPPEPPRFESRGEWRPAPPPPPPRFAQGPGPCRVFVKRRIDAYGDEVVRRVRVCDEAPEYRDRPRWDGPHWGGTPPWRRHRHWEDEAGDGRW